MKVEARHKASALRKRGYSLKEISQILHVSKSSVSLWVRDVRLSPKAEQRLLGKITLGQFVSAKRKREKIQAIEQNYINEADKEMRVNPNRDKILCAMLYWCEGAKNPKNGVAFTNSDPLLIKKFLELFRESFALDEKKFRLCIHLHSYHHPQNQIDFWSKITHIDKSQFMKPYQKPNGGKRIRQDYQGCLSLRYRSNDLARQLLAIAKAYLRFKGV